MGAVGSYLRHIENSADRDPFNRAAREKLDNLDGKPNVYDDSSSEFGNWSPAKQRAYYETLSRTDVERADIHATAKTFIGLHPEWIDSHDNSMILNRTLRAMYGNDVVPTIEQFEAAYKVAGANNNLELNQVEIAKQQKAALKQLAAKERSRIVYRTEQELESLSLEQIRHLDSEERQRQMQRLGEEGGL
jgi:hypothetical protein